MNEHLKKIDKKAVDYALSVCDANGLHQGKEYLAVVKEKFAKLIIEECMNRAQNIAIAHSTEEGTYAAGKKAGAFECAEDFKIYFGV